MDTSNVLWDPSEFQDLTSFLFGQSLTKDADQLASGCTQTLGVAVTTGLPAKYVAAPAAKPSPLQVANTSQAAVKNIPPKPAMDIVGRRSVSFDADMDDDDQLLLGKMDGPEGRRFLRQNHSEIEKRRRDKMNSYITELSTMVPMCSAMNRKLDKLTVLRMAVQHMKTLRGAGDTVTEISHKPSFLSDEELKHLILQAAEGFLFVVSCDRGRILYVSESVKEILNYSQSELIGQSLFDILHPRDITKVKEQLTSSDLSPRERLIDAKTMMPVKTEMPQKQSPLCSGARRSFFCRMKTAAHQPFFKQEKYMSTDSSPKKRNKDFYPQGQLQLSTVTQGSLVYNTKNDKNRKNYSVIHCTSYLKSWPPAKMGIEEDNELENDGCNLSCLVAIGQLQPPFQPPLVTETKINVRPLQFISRHSIDGKFTYIDQRATTVLGYLPQELLGTSVYEYYHFEDITKMADVHKTVLKVKERIHSEPYRFKARDGSFVHLKAAMLSFKNPWTKEIEYIISTHTVLRACELPSSSSPGLDSGSCMDGEDLDCSDLTMAKKQINMSSQGSTILGVGKIGSQIAEEAIEMQREVAPSEKMAASSTAPKLAQAAKSMLRKGALTMAPGTSTVQRSGRDGLGAGRNNTITTVNGITLPSRAESVTSEADLLSNIMDTESVISSDTGTDGSGEAAMSLLMNLLEADAGLGGPVDFSDLPWPL